MNTIKIEKRSEIIEKKSKFLGFSFFVKNEKEVKDRLEKLKKEYKDAKHIVYAYRLEDNGIKEKFHNNKEPVNSAGKPLLYLVQKKDMISILIVVIRYFGGTKLGVGGLIRAYTKAGKKVIE